MEREAVAERVSKAQLGTDSIASVQVKYSGLGKSKKTKNTKNTTEYL